MPTPAQQALQSATLYTDDERYRIIQLPLNRITAAAGVLAEVREPFAALIIDKDEVSLVLTEGDLEDFARRLRDFKPSEAAYRLITFDLPLDPNLVGFMAAISGALADAGVTILPFAAFSRDHLLVTVEQFDLAWTTLERLRSTP